jgi:ABC-2 type transport system ATP-binding protein
MDDGIVIKADTLTKKFGNFTAVDSISFDVAGGEIFGFLGANGAGKTTAIKMLTGLWRPTSGSAEVAGFDISKQQEKVKLNIGYMSQRFSLYEDLTVSENIEFYGGIYGLRHKVIQEKMNKLLEQLGLESSRKKLIGSLPLGWKQKLAFSIAIIHEPKIVFLDEPTGGVDPITRRQFWDLIYEASAKGTTVFVTTHYMDEAEYCDRVSIMVAGKIEAIGTPSELKKEHNVDSINNLFVKLARPAVSQSGAKN